MLAPTAEHTHAKRRARSHKNILSNASHFNGYHSSNIGAVVVSGQMRKNTRKSNSGRRRRKKYNTICNASQGSRTEFTENVCVYIYLFVVLDFRQRKNNIVRCVGLSLSSSISRAHTSLSFAKMKKNQTIALKTIDFIECPHTQFLLAKYRITEKESERVCVCVSSGVRKRKW